MTRVPVRLSALGMMLAVFCAFAISSAYAAHGSSPGRILFASNRAENLKVDVFAVGVDRYSRRNLTGTLLEDEYRPRPSPDGRRILFQLGFPDASILVMDRNGANARKVGAGGSPVWSPDGTKIAYTRAEWIDNRLHTEIFVIDADGSGVRALGAGESPSWSPDGRLAFFRREGSDRHFFVANADGSDERRLALQLSWNGLGSPRWSPDGRRLVAASSSGARYVAVVDVATGDARQLVPGAHPEWYPDGSLIAFARPAVVRRELA